MKKKLFLLGIALSIFLFGFSQDYTCIKPGHTVYYKTLSAIEDYFIYPAIIENTTISNDTIFLHNITDWMFKGISIAPDGITQFENDNMEKITINTIANIDDTWVLYTYPNGNFIQAKLTEINQETFIDVTDEVKTINFQLKDIDGNNLSDDVNEEYIKLSKNHGFIHVPRLSKFPMNTSDINGLDIVGYDAHGYSNFGVDAIFNLDVGDKIGSLERKDIWGEPNEEYHTILKKIEEITAKSISENGTIINYDLDVCYSFYWQGMTEDNVTYERSLSINKSLPEYECYNQISTTTRDYFDDTGYCKRITVGSSSDSKYIISILEGYDVNNLTQTVPDPSLPPYYPYIKTYKIGKMGPYYVYDYNFDWIEFKLSVNYQSCSVLLDTEEIGFNDEIIIYPNPVNNTLNIQLNTENDTEFRLLIFDITGRKHLEINEKSNLLSFDTSKLVDGVYVLQLINDKGIFTKKFRVNHY